MTASRIFFYFCLSFIFGIGMSSFFHFPLIFQFFLLILAIFFICVFWSKKRIVVFGFCLIFLIFGIFRNQTATYQLERPKLKTLFNKKVILIGEVIEEPKIGTNNIRLKIKVKELKSNILVTTHFYDQINYGDVLKIEGVLKEPPKFEGFNYKDYLKNQGIYFLMDYPKIEILKRGCGNPIKKILISFKNELKQSLERIVPFSQAGFFEALIFGEENNISREWKEKLNITGTRHIAAVSGTNITLICDILLSLLLSFGFWRKHALWLSLFLIFFYILMIGAPSSAIRAGIMGGLLLIAQNFGRLYIPERIMVFALSLMLLFNPLLLKSDIGFQLSFLAVAGLIYLQPFFSKIFEKLPNFLDFKLNLSATIAAQVFTLPILLYNFGQFSLVSPLTNVLILPAIPYLTILGFLFSFLGMFSQILGQIVSLPAQVLLMLVMKIIDIFAQLPFAAITTKISPIFLIVSYFLLTIFVFHLKRKQRLWFLDY